jgi:hypothetical protein
MILKILTLKRHGQVRFVKQNLDTLYALNYFIVLRWLFGAAALRGRNVVPTG